MSDDQQRSKKTLRQYKRYLRHKDAEDIILNAAEGLSASSLADEYGSLIEVLQNFPQFIDSIERSYSEYEDRLSMASRSLEISSKELTTTLSEVEVLNSNINLMLDSLGQGLLFFDDKGQCSAIYSQSCLDLLNMDPAEKSLPFVLGFDDQQKETFNTWLNIVFSGSSAMDFDDLKMLLPREIRNQKSAIIELDYKPMYLYEGKLSGVLLIATDVTYQRMADEKHKILQKEAERVQQIAQDRNGFYDLITDMFGFLNMVETLKAAKLSDDDITLMKRMLHTFKGIALSYSLDDTGKSIHEIETWLEQKTGKSPTTAAFLKQLSALKNNVIAAKEYAQQLFGPSFMAMGKIKMVDTHLLKTLEDKIATLPQDSAEKKALLAFVQDEFLSVEIKSLFSGFEREIFRLCQLYGKENPEITITGGDLKIIPEHYDGFFKTLIHLARNIADHAIESKNERKDIGKDATPSVCIDIQEDESNYKLVIKDDGRGINPDMIRAKLADNNRDTEDNISDEKVIYHIFDADFSSSNEVNDTSGRGIGMNAIYSTVINMGGDISVTSDFKNSGGTSFEITLPKNLNSLNDDNAVNTAQAISS